MEAKSKLLQLGETSTLFGSVYKWENKLERYDRVCHRVAMHLTLIRRSPLERVLALRSEVVDVRLEMQLEDVVLVDVLGL